jgi:HAD superfamily hydrolase (TIGR01490 family)
MKAAFFDIDGTIYRDSLLTEHFKRLIKYELIDPRQWENKVKDLYTQWDMRKGGYDAYLLGLVDSYVEAIQNITVEQNEFVANQVMDVKAGRVYKYTRDRVKWHRAQGHKVIFISGSPEFLVSKMAKKYGADDYCGTIYHDDGEKFTGETTPMWDSVSKQKAIDKFVEKYNLNLEESYAYGDTNGDLTMMKSVGHPITINPAKGLLENIQNDEKLKEKIQIIVERKDVIYKLSSDVEIYECSFIEDWEEE